MLRFGRTLLAVLTLGACTTTSTPPRRSPDTWAFLLERGGITAYVDTGRVTSSGAIARVWLRFDHHQTMPKMESTTGPWSRMEAETDLDCEARKARDVTLRLMDSTGTVVGDTTWGLGEWQPFQEHALGIHILQPACEALGKGRAA